MEEEKWQQKIDQIFSNYIEGFMVLRRKAGCICEEMGRYLRTWLYIPKD